MVQPHARSLWHFIITLPISEPVITHAAKCWWQEWWSLYIPVFDSVLVFALPAAFSQILLYFRTLQNPEAGLVRN